MHKATAITTGSANQRPNTPCIRLWIDVTFRGLEDSYNFKNQLIAHWYVNARPRPFSWFTPLGLATVWGNPRPSPMSLIEQAVKEPQTSSVSCKSIRCHIYDWKIESCKVKQQIVRPTVFNLNKVYNVWSSDYMDWTVWLLNKLGGSSYIHFQYLVIGQWFRKWWYRFVVTVSLRIIPFLT